MPLWFRLKCLNKYWLACHDILYKPLLSQRINPTDFGHPLIFPLGATMMLTFLFCGETSPLLLDGLP